jgi:hypothetical protein
MVGGAIAAGRDRGQRRYPETGRHLSGLRANECIDARRAIRDGVEHADVSLFTERAEPVYRLRHSKFRYRVHRHARCLVSLSVSWSRAHSKP